MKATRPVKVKRTVIEPEPEVKPEPEPTSNKYARRVKIGQKKPIGNSRTIESVGLGSLRVITH